MEFESIFGKNNIKLNESRDKFLSRIFGIFNEKIVEIWCNSEKSDYDNLGRPTVYDREKTLKGSTLDFTLREKNGGKTFISEMKCEIQFEKFKYLELNSVIQLKHHNKIAFNRFLGVAKEPQKYKTKVKGEKEYREIDGAILIWGKIDPNKKTEICDFTKLTDILSLEVMINDLIEIQHKEYYEFINQREEWLKYLFDGLKK